MYFREQEEHYKGEDKFGVAPPFSLILEDLGFSWLVLLRNLLLLNLQQERLIAQSLKKT